MAITSNAAITMSALRTEYKDGTGPVSMSELNRGGGNFPLGGTRNNTVPTTDNNLAFSKYRNTSKTVVVTYEIIGAGGAGGFGVNNEGEQYRGTYGATGGTSRITKMFTIGSLQGSTAMVIVIGGGGGENCKFARGSVGENGAASHYGSGGAGGARNRNGNTPATNSYGAGGGGGGGDNGDFWDAGGCAGEGGGAGTRQTGTFTVIYDTVITLTIGAKGATNTIGYHGASGADGYGKLTWDANVHTRTNTGVGTGTIN